LSVPAAPARFKARWRAPPGPAWRTPSPKPAPERGARRRCCGAKNNGHGIIQESVANNPKRNGNWGERIFNYGNLNDENFLKKNLLLPVPKDEIDTNSAIE
jgi:hypothetical protein